MSAHCQHDRAQLLKGVRAIHSHGTVAGMHALACR